MAEMFQHGRYGSYGRGCRCDSCREAWRVYKRNRRRPENIPDGAPHGVSVAANYGCRCEVCREATRKRSADRRDYIYSKRKQRQQELAEQAVSHKRPWTAREKAIALSPSFTDSEAARELGRTLYSIRYMRRKMRRLSIQG